MITEVTKVPFAAYRMKQDREEEQAYIERVLMLDKRSQEQQDNMALLEQCRGWWDSLRDFRQRRRRNRMYHRGKQWQDLVLDPDDDSKTITEEEYIKKQGKVPLKQNIIRQMMKNLLGQHRASQSKTIVLSRSKGGEEGADLLSNAIMHVHDLNFLEELDTRSLEEFALSGMVVQKETYKHFKTRDQEDVRVDNVNPNRFFFNTDMQDVRGTDVRILGEIIDTTIDDIVSTFAKTPEEEERIMELYSTVQKDVFYDYTGLDASRLDNLDFYLPEDTTKARVYEVWYLKSQWMTKVHDYADGSYEITNLSMEDIAIMNQERIAFGKNNGVEEYDIPLIEGEPIKEQVWMVKYLTPFGQTLWEGESPYEHQEHPYSFHAYPMIDGEVWGFVEDIIDQQRYINRMIIMMDFIMSASAKGVLMVPEDVIPDGMNPEDFAEEWRSFNGVIVYKPSAKHGKIPEQITSNSTVVGLGDMIKFQMQFMSDISGIHGAIQGKEARSGTPSSLYAQEASNASTNTLDFFMSFNFFRQKRDEKILKLILQYYTEERYFAIEGETDVETKLFDPNKVKGKLYDLKVAQNNDTPIYRQMINETLTQLLMNQLIDIETYLENSSMPYAKSILDSLRRRKEEIEERGAPDMAAANQDMPSDPKNQELLQKAIMQ